jgi:hypothetical protein
MTVDVVDFTQHDNITVQAICSSFFGPQPLHLQVDYGANLYTLSLLNAPQFGKVSGINIRQTFLRSTSLRRPANIRRNFLTPPVGIVINEIRIDEPAPTTTSTSS